MLVAAVFAASCAVPAAASGQTPPAYLNSVSNASTLSGATAVAVSGTHAYVTSYWNCSLTAVDISSPASPFVSGASASNGAVCGASGIAISGGYAFVVSKNLNASKPTTSTDCTTGNNDNGQGNSLSIFDIHTHPDAPAFVGAIQSSTALFGAYGIGVSTINGTEYAFVAYQGILSQQGIANTQPCTPDTSTGGFTVIDLTNKNSPSLVPGGNIDNGPGTTECSAPAPLNHADSLAIYGNYAYVTAFCGYQLTVIDISNPNAPRVVAALHDGTHLAFPNDVAISADGHYAYVADQTAGSSDQFTVVDISNPLSPKYVAAISDPALLNNAYRIRVRGSFAYIAAFNAATMAVIDISDPSQPRVVGSYTDGTHLNLTTGIDLDSTSAFAISTSPRLSSQTASTTYPAYPLQGGPTITGTVSMIQLDPAPISVSLTSEPPSSTTQISANFGFSVNDDISTVRCSLDGAAYGLCTTPTSQTYSSLGAGTHTFTVEAIDSAGNTNAATYSWQVTAVPANTSPPSIAGSRKFGSTLTASNGTWSGGPTSFAYQWERCSQAGTGCQPIPGANSASYVLGRADVGSTMLLVVTASNAFGSAGASSPTTRIVSGAPFPLVAPSISGKLMQGENLTAQLGTWSGYPAPTLTVKWLRCARGSCTGIAGATSTRYVPGYYDVGYRMELRVIAASSAGADTVYTAQTAVVKSNVGVGLSGVAKGSPKLSLTVKAVRGGLVQEIDVVLPTYYIHFVRGLLGRISVRDARGHVQRGVKVSLRGDELVIKLRKRLSTAKVVITALAARNSLRRQAQSRHKPSIGLLVKVLESGHISTYDQLTIKLS